MRILFKSTFTKKMEKKYDNTPRNRSAKETYHYTYLRSKHYTRSPVFLHTLDRPSITPFSTDQKFYTTETMNCEPKNRKTTNLNAEQPLARSSQIMITFVKVNEYSYQWHSIITRG